MGEAKRTHLGSDNETIDKRGGQRTAANGAVDEGRPSRGYDGVFQDGVTDMADREDVCGRRWRGCPRRRRRGAPPPLRAGVVAGRARAP